MRQMKTCINKIIYTSLLLGLTAVTASSLWSAQPKPAKATPGNIIVEIKKAEIKSQPTASSGIIAVAFKGEIFKVLHELPGWYLIELSPGKEGYLAKKYARFKSAVKTPKIVARTLKPILLKRETTENFVLIVSTGSYIRTSPAVNGKILAQAKINNAFRLLKKVSPDWYEAVLTTGKKCYIPASVVRIINAAELSQIKEQWKKASVSKAVPQPKPESQPVPVVTPQPQPVSSLYAVALKNGIILRQEPNINARILVTAKQGDNYKLISQEVNWSQVMLTEGQQAYVLTKVVKIVSAADLPAAIAEASKAAKDIKLKYVSVTEKVAKLRARASDTAKVISIATQGTEFKLVWVYKDWYEVLTSSGTAFISDKSAGLVNAKETESQKSEKVPETIQPEEKTIPTEKPAEEIKIKTEEKPTKTKPAESTEESWLKDKYVLVTNSQVNVRESADKKSKIMVRVNAGATFKLLTRNKDWYEIFLPPDQNAFIAASLTEIITEADVLAGPKKWEETKKERQAVLRQDQEAQKQAQKEAERKSKLETKALKDAAEKARLENEKKTREDAERRAKEAAELKAKHEAEAHAQEQEWLKDKYVLVKVKKAVLQNKPNIKGKILATVNIGDSYKLVSRSKEWYEIGFSSGTAFLNANLGKILTEAELTAHRQREAEAKALKEAAEKARIENERKTREDAERRAKEAAELKTKKEAEAKAQEQEWLKDKYIIVTGKNINVRQAPNKAAAITAKIKTGQSYKLVSRFKEWYEVKLSTGTGVAFIAASLADIISEKELEVMREIEKDKAEEKANLLREAAELKERQAAETKAKNEAWCKDKYVVVMTSDTNLRSQPAINAKILTKANKDDIFKILDRGKEWYEIFLPPDQNAFVNISLVDILTEGEVESRVKKEREPILAQAQKEAEAKAHKLRQAVDLKERKEAEEKARLENEKKTKEDAERRAKETAELKAKTETEAKTKEIEWLKDKYVLVIKQTSFYPAPNKKAAVSGTAAPDTSYKIVTRTNDWYGVDTSSGTAFILIDRVKLLAEQELTAYRQKQEQVQQEKAREKAEAKAQQLREATELAQRQEAELKAKLENEKKTREDSERRAKEAAELKAKEEAETKAKELEWLKDKYILVEKQTSFYPAPNIKAAVSGTAAPDSSNKIVTRTKKWYGIDTSSGTAFVPIDKVKLLTEQELTAYRQQQDKTRQEKLQKEAAEKARKEEELNAKLEAERKAKEETSRQEADAKAQKESFVQDKYILLLTDNTNLRSAPNKSSPIITRARAGEYYKLVWIAEDAQKIQWYQVDIPSGKQIIKAYINSALAQAVSKDELDSFLLARQKESENKFRQPTPEAPAQPAKPATIESLSPATTAPVTTVTEKPAQAQLEKEAEQKAKADAKILAYIEDKYVLTIIDNTNIRIAPDKNAPLITKAKIDESFKVTWVKKDQINTPWYQVSLTSGTQLIDGYVISTLTKLVTKQQLGEHRFAQEQAMEEKARLETERNAKIKAERQAKLESEQKAKAFREATELAQRQEAERQAKEDAELKAKLMVEEKAKKEVLRQAQEAKDLAQKEAERKLKLEKLEAAQKAAEEKARLEAESKANEDEWLKDKYILTTINNSNLRVSPNKNSNIISKVPTDQSFKLTARVKDWYQIDTSSGTLFISTQITKVLTSQELTTYRQQQEQTRQEKMRFAAEAKAKQEVLRQAQEAKDLAQKEAERKSKLEKLEAEQKAKAEAEIKAKAAAEEKERLEATAKAAREAELKTKEEAAKRAKEEAERKARELRAATELAQRQEAELKARLETERLARLEAERKAKAEAKAKATEEAAQRKAKAKARIESYVKDKFILTILDNTNLRTAPDKNSPILAKVNSDVSFKVTWIMPDKQNVPWYQVSITSGIENIPAYVISTLAKLMTEPELSDHRLAQTRADEEKAMKFREATELAQRQEAERQTQAEAERLARIEVLQEAERKLRLEKLAAEQIARELREAAELAKRQEAEQKAKLAAEQKAKDEAEAFAHEQEWLKDKYILIINPETNIRKAPSKNAEILSKALLDREYKLFSRSKNNEWYEIVSLTGTGFVNATVVKLLTEQELIVLRQQQEQTRLEKLRKETEAKARREAELQAKLETVRKATAEQAKQIEEARAKETEWLKDKYILVPDKNISLRTAPNSTANLLDKTSNSNESFKLLSRADMNWYQIQTSAGTAFIAAAAARVMSEQELNIFRVAEQQAKAETELQANLAAEEKAKKEAETKAAREAVLKAKIEQEQIIREERFKKETAEKAQREIEQQAKLEAGRKAKEETELKAQQTAEIKARLENESKAKMEAYVADKFVLITGAADLKKAASLNSKNISRAKAGESFKVSWIENEEWFRVITNNGQTAFLTAATVKLVTEKELSALREAEAKAKLETELQAKEAAALKEKLAAEEKARKEAALIAKLESDRQAREEKLRQQTEAQARQQAERQAKLEAEQKVREEAERKLRLEKLKAEQKEAEEKAKKEAALKAQQEAEQKARAEAERKARETAEAKTRIETEAKAKMEAYVKDKYIVIADNNAAVRTAPDILASVLYVAEENESFKLQWIRENWYEIKVPSGTALRTGFLDVSAAKSMTMTELAAWQKVQEQERLTREDEELKARQQAELKAKEEEALKIKLVAEQKVREEAERKLRLEKAEAERQAKLEAEQKAREKKARLEAEAKTKQEAELKAKLEAEQKAKAEAERQAKEVAEALATEQEWLKNKYVLINTKDTNIRTKASKNADIINKAPIDKDYKLISRSRNNEWYQIDISSGTAFVNAVVVKVMTTQELAVYRQQQEQARLENAKKLRTAAALKEQQAAEEKARKEAELKARHEAEQQARIAAEQKAKEFREATELAKRQEAKLKAKLMAEEKAKKETAEKVREEDERKLRLEKLEAAQKTAEEKARIEAEQKAKAVVEKISREEQARMETTAKTRAEAEQIAKAEEAREDQAEYAYIIINASYAEIKSVPDLGAPALLIALKSDIFKYNGQQKGWYNILTFSGETRFVRKSLCRGTNIAPALVKDESQRKDIYDSLIDAKDRAMSEANQKYPSIKSQSELQEKIFYQQTVEEKFILEVFHKYKIQPATYLTLLSEAISKNW